MSVQNPSLWFQVGVSILGFLLILPVPLFVVGQLLGRFTLALVQYSSTRYILTVLGLPVRLLYSAVILLATLYFYVSIPLLIIGLLAVAIGGLSPGLTKTTSSVRYFRENLGFVVIIGGILVTFVPVLAALYFSKPRRNPNQRFLSRSESPLLWDVVDDVAKQVGTHPVDKILLIPYTSIAVSEEGGLSLRFWKRRERQLTLGFGSLPGMTQGQFKAILAHEYGHFSNRDLAGINRAYQVQIALIEMRAALDEEAASARYLLWTIFLLWIRFLLKVYYFYIFFPVTRGATQIQEMMADRFAARSYGSVNFANGLKHVVWRGMVFEIQLKREEQEARRLKRRLQNLYTLPDLDAELGQKVISVFHQVMSRRPSLYDSHPSPEQRIQLADALKVEKSFPGDSEAVWKLFSNSEGLQMEMTGVIQRLLYSHYGHSWAK